MKLFAGIIVVLGFMNVAFADANPADVATYTFTGEAAAAKLNIMPGTLEGSGPMSVCHHISFKQELSSAGLESTVCTENRGDVECGTDITQYSCTVTLSKNGQKLPALPVAVAH